MQPWLQVLRAAAIVVAALFMCLLGGVAWWIGDVWVEADRFLRSAEVTSPAPSLRSQFSSRVLRAAIIAAEVPDDARSACGFFNTKGPSPPSQYVATRVYAAQRHDRTLRSGVVRAAMACQIEQRFTGDEIVSLVMKAGYFGRGAYGVQDAAQAWFGKPVNALTAAESAFIAGRLRSPGDMRLGRPSYILSVMHKSGSIDQAEYSTAIAEPLHIITAPNR